MEKSSSNGSLAGAVVSAPRRFTELDSVRGLAAMTVVFSHFQELWFPKDLHQKLAGWQRAMHLGLHLVDGGREAVVLFFILSGFVLALPYASGRQLGYPVFIARRVLRIYGPYSIALCLAVGCVAVWHGNLHRGAWAAQIWSQPPSVHLVLQHVLFLGVYNFHPYNPVFWSLVYEMRISLIFPLLVLIVGRLNKWTDILLALGLSALSAFVICRAGDKYWVYNLTITLHYVGIFIVGILLSWKHERIGRAYRSLPRVLQFGLAVVAFLIYRESTRVSEIFLSHALPFNAMYIVSDWFVVVGASLAIVGALHSDFLRWALNLEVPRFLGKISYSLYLVHFPVLFAMAFIFGTRLSMLPQFFLYLGGALSLATVFHYLVEAPFTRLSHQVGKRVRLIAPAAIRANA